MNELTAYTMHLGLSVCCLLILKIPHILSEILLPKACTSAALPQASCTRGDDSPGLGTNRRKTVQEVRWESVSVCFSAHLCVCVVAVSATQLGRSRSAWMASLWKGGSSQETSVKRLCVCVPGFVHCELRCNKQSLCSSPRGIRQHKPPMRKAL